jgi:hypothetical protein
VRARFTENHSLEEFRVNVLRERDDVPLQSLSSKIIRCGEDFLLDALGTGFGVDQSFKNSENVAAVFNEAREYVAKIRLALCLAMPFQQHFLRHFDVPAKFFRGMSAQEQSIEKRRLPLREVEIVLRFIGRVSGRWKRRVGFGLHMI